MSSAFFEVVYSEQHKATIKQRQPKDHSSSHNNSPFPANCRQTRPQTALNRAPPLDIAHVLTAGVQTLRMPRSAPAPGPPTPHSVTARIQHTNNARPVAELHATIALSSRRDQLSWWQPAVFSPAVRGAIYRPFSQPYVLCSTARGAEYASPQW